MCAPRVGGVGLTGAVLPLVVVGDRAALGVGADCLTGPVDAVLEEVRRRQGLDRPRWVVSSVSATAAALLADRGLRVDRCWDVTEVHRLLHGGWDAPLGQVWAGAHGLDAAGVPTGPSGDLFDFASEPADRPADPESPVRADGHLRVDAFDLRWAHTDSRLASLTSVLAELGRRQEAALAELGPRAVSTAHAESAAALLCAELARDGLPVDRAEAERLIAESVGPRPVDDTDARRIRRERDAVVLRLSPGREHTDLRNPTQVRELLTAVGVVVDNTRAHSLEPFRHAHPLVGALLRWRKAERIATTYGYSWLDTHVGVDGRLRGGWTACDGAAGRMTAQNGLHNLPAPLRPAVAAEPGHVFVRADLGQIEPRVLAAVSGDVAFAAAARADDLYAPVASRLGVDRSIAKVAVLAAMYGQRSGAAGEALKGLERAYPTAMTFLDQAYAAGVAARPLRTYGGRRIGLDRILREGDPGTAEASDSARGRFARNALVQGAAAELFKAWSATVRATTWDLDARIVLCLHDELLVHVPEAAAEETRVRVVRALEDSARRWTGSAAVRFVADTSVIRRWSEAKG